MEVLLLAGLDFQDLLGKSAFNVLPSSDVLGKKHDAPS